MCKRHCRYSLDGTCDRLLTKLLVNADPAGEIDWQVSVDSTTRSSAPAQCHGRRSRLTPTSQTGGSVE